MRILIVEDDPLMQLGLEQALSEQPDFEIVGQASDGLAGVQLALSLRPDLVVMDIGLPRLDGIAATKQIKEGLANVHVVPISNMPIQVMIDMHVGKHQQQQLGGSVTANIGWYVVSEKWHHFWELP